MRDMHIEGCMQEYIYRREPSYGLPGVFYNRRMMTKVIQEDTSTWDEKSNETIKSTGNLDVLVICGQHNSCLFICYRGVEPFQFSDQYHRQILWPTAYRYFVMDISPHTIMLPSLQRKTTYDWYHWKQCHYELICNVKVHLVRNYRSQYRTTQKRASPAYIFSFQHFNQNLDIFWKLLMASWRKHTSNTEAQAGYRDIAWPDSTMVVCLLTTACYSQLIAVALPSTPAVLSWKSTFPRHLLAATIRTDSLALLDHKFAANIYQKSMFKANFLVQEIP